MKTFVKYFATLVVALFAISYAFAQGYKVGDEAVDFKLKNIDNKMVSLSDYKDAKGFYDHIKADQAMYTEIYKELGMAK